MIEKTRIQFLNDKKIANRKFVVYWMQASQRAEYNHALEYAVMQANKLGKALIVFFGLTDRYPLANERHYVFILEGLVSTRKALEDRGIKMIVQIGPPEQKVVELAKEASLVIVDRGYTRIQKYWRKYAANLLDCPLIQVESNVIVPIEEVSLKEEYSAATSRSKIYSKFNDYLVPLRRGNVRKESLGIRIEGFKIDNTEDALSQLEIDRSIKRIEKFRGGAESAKQFLEAFLSKKLKDYDKRKNDPTIDGTSHLSPYLHFGHISPLYIALQVMKYKGAGKDAFLEELIVRRELSANYVYYIPNYDSFGGLPEWSRTTLKEHENDRREFNYTLSQLEKAQTHDPYWNTAQKEMAYLGKMHGYMRMYWGKKILEWTERPEDAFKIALYLNDKYELDGGDPNGYAGVAWCFGKHDRPWPERPIFGKVRYMNAEGLKRKFDIERYVQQIDEKLRDAVQE